MNQFFMKFIYVQNRAIDYKKIDHNNILENTVKKYKHATITHYFHPKYRL